jgi:hypothetical protein
MDGGDLFSTIDRARLTNRITIISPFLVFANIRSPIFLDSIDRAKKSENESRISAARVSAFSALMSLT